MEQFAPGLRAFAITIDNGQQFLGSPSEAAIKTSTQLRSSSSRTLK
jgi:hypothetical protein